MVIDLPRVNGNEELDLGEVLHMAQVWVNETSAGERLWAPFTFRIGHLLRPGRNEIHIKVGNLLLNAVTQYIDYNWKWLQPPEEKRLDAGLFAPMTLIRE